ncbi:MAG: hypothetical protein ACYDHX_03985 [Methanothrix sp.]
MPGSAVLQESHIQEIAREGEILVALAGAMAGDLQGDGVRGQRTKNDGQNGHDQPENEELHGFSLRRSMLAIIQRTMFRVSWSSNTPRAAQRKLRKMRRIFLMRAS